MARNESLDAGDKARLMRALAFQIHRKRVADEVLLEYIEDQFQLGRRREYRPAADVLESHGFVAALRALDMIGEEAALVLGPVVEFKDHRLLSSILGSLADRLESQV